MKYYLHVTKFIQILNILNIQIVYTIISNVIKNEIRPWYSLSAVVTKKAKKKVNKKEWAHILD